ncbi:MAG: NAD(P)/FAD-dependent oxidoreductase, partial [Candidatus Obscuribacterales bacterium]|nr:NAD(P)/FAD-dependent oxidoreductase [Candidatus Obscuribacterales bacterium]
MSQADTGTKNYDVIIIGAGAAGMMCAIQAGKRGRSVLLIDHSEKIGRKILISGGGRCNFTNIHAKPENFHSANPHFCKSALSRYTPKDFISLVEAHRIRYHEKKLGQLFCDGSAQAIVEMLVTECKKAKAGFLMETRVLNIEKNETAFLLQTTRGRFKSQSLVVATGGLSIPKIGASKFGYDVASQFGLKIENTFPALVGFDLKPEDRRKLADLTGLAFDSNVSCGKHKFRENTLFTHTGLSGPAILQASLYWKPGDPLRIDVCPERDLLEHLEKLRQEKCSKELKNVLAEILPRNFADKLCELFLASKPLNSLAAKTLADFSGKLQDWSIFPERNFGYGKAEVTRGGVSTDELSSKTME